MSTVPSADENQSKEKDNFLVSAPSVTLPKGGGALRNIDEKFQVNAANGTSSFSLPLPFSKARNGFTPAISLNYNSGSGSGIFGLGWGLDLPSIQRKTDKKYPEYKDALESDVFMFSGAEDLVPFLKPGVGGVFELVEALTATGEFVKRYRPRIEGAFNRIERITPAGENWFFWKVTSPDNVVTVFGKNAAARIADPSEPNRIYKWLPDFGYDDHGNCILYTYIKEDLVNVALQLHEQNRFKSNAPFANTYLKSVSYGNVVPYAINTGNPYSPDSPATSYLFETVFDYGDHNPDRPTPGDPHNWPARIDAFSDYRAGFEIRTYRMCSRILFYHHFKELSADGIFPANCLVRSLDFDYKLFNNPAATANDKRNSETDFITSARQSGYIRLLDGSYSKKGLPPIEFTYQLPQWNSSYPINDVLTEDLANAPVGIGKNYQWTDLWSEGISGILTEQAGGWFYKSNLGDGHFSAAAAISPKPALVGLQNGSLELQDLEADGRKFIVNRNGRNAGYFELTEWAEWQPFIAFAEQPNVNFNDPNSRLIDLNGDGRADVLISGDNIFTWYACEGIAGYDPAEYSPKPYDEEKGPAMVFSDATESIFLADMSGDGMTDIVRVRNGEVCYWPNKGYGTFGAKVNMTAAPWFDNSDLFNPAYLHLADVSGTGATDLLYLGKNQFRAWINCSGNSWSQAFSIDPFPDTASPGQISVVDFLGNGTSCIVWTSPLPGYAGAPMRYIDLMGGIKPYLMTGYVNNFGKQVSWLFKSSTYFYLQDKQAGNPWITKLPFPVHCVTSVTITDAVAATTLVNSYSYHHGYYDHAEKEFRGFGRVEQTDAEEFDNFELDGLGNVTRHNLDQFPVKTISWFHTGVYFNGQQTLAQYVNEYNTGPFEFPLAQPVFPGQFTPDEYREAFRACKGMLLRKEIYALDKSPAQGIPYSVSSQNFLVRRLQPQLPNRYAVFLTHESETLQINYERDFSDPRIAHKLNLDIDDAGNINLSAAVVYGRKQNDLSLPAGIRDQQGAAHVVITENSFTINPLDPATDFYFDTPALYRAKKLAETRTYELTQTAYDHVTQFSISGLLSDFAAAAVINYNDLPGGALEKRLVEDLLTRYLDDNLSTVMPLGRMGAMGLVYQSYKLAFTPGLLAHYYGALVTNAMLTEAGYLQADGVNWWVPSGRNVYRSLGETVAAASVRFFTPVAVRDPFDKETQLFYDDYSLILTKTVDPLLNTAAASAIDYRTLQPATLNDINNNTSETLTDELGMVIATAVYGDEGDGTHGDKTLSLYTVVVPANLDHVTAHPQSFLQQATSFFYYDLFAWVNLNQPVRFAAVTRETHVSELSEGAVSNVFISVGYSSGSGQILQTKTLTDPGEALVWEAGALTTVNNANPRWIGSGRKILNNKGNAVKQYEPFFSTTYAYEDEKALVEIGFAEQLSYDPLSRVIMTVYPDGTFSTVEFNAWQQKHYDRNDTVKDSSWYTKRISHPDPLIATPEEVDAANKAAAHYHTPSQAHLDSLDRTIYTIADNGPGNQYPTTLLLDIENNRRQVTDARNNKVITYDYDMISRPAHQNSMDTGEQWVLNDVSDKALYKWDSLNHRFRSEYDDLRRQTNQWLITDTTISVHEILIDVVVYGEGQVLGGKTDTQLNLRGKVFISFDGSGCVQTTEYDFKGNVKSSQRQLTLDYKNTADWNVPNRSVLLNTAETFLSTSSYDATGKATEIVMPDGSRISPFYNQSNLVDRVQVFIPSADASVDFIRQVTYNAKGQRERIVYGNNTATGYTYEETAYRLKRLLTTRNTGADAMQDLNYTYDPAGNITTINDNAQQKVFFNNAGVDPGNNFTYDAIYRLINAQGREHAGQNAPGDQFDPDKTQDGSGNRLVLPGDMNAMQRYEQQYSYDEAGNLLQLIHNAGNGAFTNRWTRVLTCNTVNNQLQTMSAGGSTTHYHYDGRGNMRNLQDAGAGLSWNYADHLQQVDLGGGGTAYYIYDTSGQRVRKVIETAAGIKAKERIYLGGLEYYREYTGANAGLERTTVHVMDGEQRVALIEARNSVDDHTAKLLIRYQYANQLGTSCLELAGTLDSADKTFVAGIISYEEYYPFGSTAYQAMDNQTEAPKRYRYTGMERDQESGLNYHSARYYMPWLCRWASCDPKGLGDGFNLYLYTHDNPVRLVDPSGNDGEDKPAPRKHPASDKIHKAAVEAKDKGDALFTLRPHIPIVPPLTLNPIFQRPVRTFLIPAPSLTAADVIPPPPPAFPSTRPCFCQQPEEESKAPILQEDAQTILFTGYDPGSNGLAIIENFALTFPHLSLTRGIHGDDFWETKSKLTGVNVLSGFGPVVQTQQLVNPDKPGPKADPNYRSAFSMGVGVNLVDLQFRRKEDTSQGLVDLQLPLQYVHTFLSDPYGGTPGSPKATEVNQIGIGINVDVHITRHISLFGQAGIQDTNGTWSFSPFVVGIGLHSEAQ